MVNFVKKKKAATFVEAVMVILVLAVLTATATGVIIFFVQLFIYSPKQLDVQKIGAELCSIMIEGSQQARGMRFAKASSILDASATQFSYTYGHPTPQDQLSVRFRWNALDKHFYRSTSSNGGVFWSAEEVIPYHILSNITIVGKETADVIFTYKKSNEQDWVEGSDPLNSIRRVAVAVNILSGSGSFKAYEGSANFLCSVEIKGI